MNHLTYRITNKRLTNQDKEIFSSFIPIGRSIRSQLVQLYATYEEKNFLDLLTDGASKFLLESDFSAQVTIQQ